MTSTKKLVITLVALCVTVVLGIATLMVVLTQSLQSMGVSINAIFENSGITVTYDLSQMSTMHWNVFNSSSFVDSEKKEPDADGKATFTIPMPKANGAMFMGCYSGGTEIPTTYDAANQTLTFTATENMNVSFSFMPASLYSDSFELVNGEYWVKSTISDPFGGGMYSDTVVIPDYYNNYPIVGFKYSTVTSETIEGGTTMYNQTAALDSFSNIATVYIGNNVREVKYLMYGIYSHFANPDYNELGSAMTYSNSSSTYKNAIIGRGMTSLYAVAISPIDDWGNTTITSIKFLDTNNWSWYNGSTTTAVDVTNPTNNVSYQQPSSGTLYKWVKNA